jgi:hypothetical protein
MYGGGGEVDSCFWLEFGVWVGAHVAYFERDFHNRELDV